METPSVSTEKNNNRNETHVSIDEILSDEMENPSVSTEKFIHEISEVKTRLAYERTQPRILHRVSPQLRENKKHIYDPVVLSLGPYHHDKSPNSNFLRVEEFKNDILNIMLDPTIQGVFRNNILDRVGEIRIFYGEVSLDEYKDEELAEMMLRDTCFVLFYMATLLEDGGTLMAWLADRLGVSIFAFSCRDIFLLENQIPFWVLNLMISLKFDEKDEGRAFLRKFLCFRSSGDHRLTRVPWEDEEREPLHLLEALRINFVEKESSSTPKVHNGKIFGFCLRWRKISQVKTLEKLNSLFRKIFGLSSTWRKISQIKTLKKTNGLFRKIFEFCLRPRKIPHIKELETINSLHRSVTDLRIKELETIHSLYRSVTDLKIKGIHFGQSSYSLGDIRFNSYWFYGKLQLPIVCINSNTQVFFSNAIALEMSPRTNTKLEVLAYVNFMKSLLESPKDVKELRDKGILFSTLRNDEHVVKVFKEIDTHGLDNFDIFDEVKRKINHHCNNRCKTWMAELFHTKFRTPWTVIALLAATFLLCLTFLQTYYTIKSTIR